MTRIVVWNIAKAEQRKLPALLELEPDIAIVPECTADLEIPDGASMAWCGANRSCGLAVIGFDGLTVRRVGPETPDEVWAMPVEVTMPVEERGATVLRILAIWAHNSAEALRAEGPDAMGPTRRALRRHRQFLSRGPAVVAGDFNHHPRWDKPLESSNHSYAIADLASLGLVSAYHRFRGVAHGDEDDPTFFTAKNADKPYHLDYCFVPETARIESVEVGAWTDWCMPGTGPSDHAPLIVEVDT